MCYGLFESAGVKRTGDPYERRHHRRSASGAAFRDPRHLFDAGIVIHQEGDGEPRLAVSNNFFCVDRSYRWLEDPEQPWRRRFVIERVVFTRSRRI